MIKNQDHNEFITGEFTDAIMLSVAEDIAANSEKVAHGRRWKPETTKAIQSAAGPGKKVGASPPLVHYTICRVCIASF